LRAAEGRSGDGAPFRFYSLTVVDAGLRVRRMRIALLALAAVLGLSACAHAPEASPHPRCPESEMASQCNSGPLKCQVDEKRVCELCRCERVVF